MGMQNFSSEFHSPEHYIHDITYRIWEERGAGRIRDWYAEDCHVYTPLGVSTSAEAVVQHTLATMHEFPDREIFGEDVIIGDKGYGFFSSERGRSAAHHEGDGTFGKATGLDITMLAIADCLCRDNQIVAEWLVRDSARTCLALGRSPIEFGENVARKKAESFTDGNEAMRQRWSDPDGLVILGDDQIANQIIDTYDEIWNDKILHGMTDRYDRAMRFEGPAGYLCYGQKRAGDLFTRLISSIPDGRFEPHHVIVHEEEKKPVRVALRWSYCGTHSGVGRYGDPTGCPLAILAISHFELWEGKIKNEWLVMDETAVYAQIAAHNTQKD